jgi:transposase-like protein
VVSAADEPGARAALDFAVNWAAAQPSPPAALRAFVRAPRLTQRQLGAVRAALDSDPSLRSTVADAASATGLAGDDAVAWLRASPSGRPAAEGSAAKVRAAEQAARQRSERQRAEVVALRRQLAEAAIELDRERRAHGETRHRLAELQDSLAAAERERGEDRRRWHDQQAELRQRISELDRALDSALEAAASQPGPERFEAQPEVRDVRRTPSRPRRRPAPVPKGIAAGSVEGVRFLLQLPGAAVVIDGYNVSMTRWPALTIAQQREALIAVCAGIAHRWGTTITLVFDGDDHVVAPGHRTVRVLFSASGEIADDVIRGEVAALPVTRQVVVVTNDRAVASDVRAAGAHVVASEAFLAATA